LPIAEASGLFADQRWRGGGDSLEPERVAAVQKISRLDPRRRPLHRFIQPRLSRSGTLPLSEGGGGESLWHGQIKDPLKELDVAELYDAYSYMELMWYEGIGLAPEGEGKQLIRKGSRQWGRCAGESLRRGLSSHPVIVAGLTRLVEATLQVRGEAEKRQVKGAKTALAQGINGPCGQAHCIFMSVLKEEIWGNA